jgi:transposase-like protein
VTAQRQRSWATFDDKRGIHGNNQTIDKSCSNLAALHAVNTERESTITIRQVKYLNNVVEQDHRAIKRITRPMLGFKDFRFARISCLASKSCI